MLSSEISIEPLLNILYDLQVNALLLNKTEIVKYINNLFIREPTTQYQWKLNKNASHVWYLGKTYQQFMKTFERVNLDKDFSVKWLLIFEKKPDYSSFSKELKNLRPKRRLDISYMYAINLEKQNSSAAYEIQSIRTRTFPYSSRYVKKIHKVQGSFNGTLSSNEVCHNLKWRTINLGLVPFGHLVSRAHDASKLSGGLLSPMYNFLSRYMKYNTNIVGSPLGEFGSLINGSMSGFAGKLMSKKIDMAFEYFEMEHSRLDYVSFSDTPIKISPTVFAMKHPGFITMDQAYKAPFRRDVWIALAVTLVIFSLVSYTVVNICSTFTGERIHYIDLLLAMVSSVLLNFSGKRVWRKKSLRIFLIFWLFCGMVISMAYSELLLSFMTLPVPEEYPETFQELYELVKKNQMKAGFVKNLGIYSVFKNADDEMLRKLWKIIKTHEDWFFNSRAHMLINCEKRKFAALDAKFFTEYIVQIFGADDIIYSKDQLYTSLYSLLVQKGNPCIENINLGIQRFQQSGIQEHVENLMFHKLRNNPWKAKKEHETSNNNEVALNITELRVPFIILATGLSLATVVLIFEILIHRYQSKNIRGCRKEPISSANLPMSENPTRKIPKLQAWKKN